MKNILITLKENHGIARNQSPVRWGIPFDLGKLTNLEQLELSNEKGQAITFQSKTTATWHDGSIRWCLLDFFADVDAQSSCTYALSIKDKASTTSRLAPDQKTLQVSETDHSLHIDTGTTVFAINKATLKPFASITTQTGKLENLDSEVVLTGAENQHYTPVIENIELPDTPAHIRLDIDFSGKFIDENEQRFANFTSTLTFYKDSAACQMDFCIHNPRAAKHPGGFWDLGDPGSIHFKDLSVEINPQNIEQFSFQTETDNEWQTSDSDNWLLHQNSSGGENWQSSNHVNAQGKVPIRFRGYQITANEKTPEGQPKALQQGLRATPTVQIQTNNSTFSAHIKQFWQNFPKSIAVDQNTLRLSLFPNEYDDLFELQGGEQKTHTLYFNFENTPDKTKDLSQPLQVILPLSYYNQAQAMPWLPERYEPSPIDEIIQQGITGDKNFFWKREHADEFGWRHFGDLWADHETLEHGNDDTLKSHYNNQYDPIYGFLRQYLLTGDKKWFELADDLAKHVMDIDIYHTDEDRLEYNHGMFWHTDHYLDAGTCTHRTFSKAHMQVDHVEQSGGGPGAEHDYTSGLLFYHLITGNQPAKGAVLEIAAWSQIANEGTGTVLELSLKILKHDLPKFKKLLNKEKLFKHLFPLSRGTGNYIQTLLNQYYLNNEDKLLSHIENVIKQTLSPLDEIKDRHFDDIEATWYYTVLLQSLMAYLLVKEQNNQIDEAYGYTKACFQHYAKWMLKNEQRYFDNKEVLVYENDTWVAQEIRKAGILMFAQRYTETSDKSYAEKAQWFTDYIQNSLSTSQQSQFTRLLVLLMQSHGQYQDIPPIKTVNLATTALKPPSPYLKITTLIARIPKDLLIRLLKLSISKEKNWLKHRISGN